MLQLDYSSHGEGLGEMCDAVLCPPPSVSSDRAVTFVVYKLDALLHAIQLEVGAENAGSHSDRVVSCMSDQGQAHVPMMNDVNLGAGFDTSVHLRWTPTQ